MIMIVKTPGSQMGSPAAAEEGGEAMGGGRGDPPNCTCTKTIDNVAADRATDSSCRRVSLLTRMRDVNSTADETISC